jgi:hypothetical protein
LAAYLLLLSRNRIWRCVYAGYNKNKLCSFAISKVLIPTLF